MKVFDRRACTTPVRREPELQKSGLKTTIDLTSDSAGSISSLHRVSQVLGNGYLTAVWQWRIGSLAPWVSDPPACHSTAGARSDRLSVTAHSAALSLSCSLQT